MARTRKGRQKQEEPAKRRRRSKREQVVRTYAVEDEEEAFWPIFGEIPAEGAVEKQSAKPERPEAPPGVKTYSMKDVVERLGVIRGTVYTWFREGWVEDTRYRNGYGHRQFTEEDMERLLAFRHRKRKKSGTRRK